MREILFSGKRIDNGEWVEGIPVKTHIGTFIVFEENPHYCDQYGYMEICELAMVDPESVRECSSVPDKNGELILEGDILKIVYLCQKPVKAVVEFTDGKFTARYSRGGTEYIDTLSGRMAQLYEIIGNIYDNPELMGGNSP